MGEAAALEPAEVFPREPSAITQSVMALVPGETRVIASGCIAQIRRACESARQKLVGSSFLIAHCSDGICVWRQT
jgi:hypothetical protein